MRRNIILSAPPVFTKYIEDEASPVEVGLCPTPRKGAAAPLTRAFWGQRRYRGLSSIQGGPDAP